MGPPLNLPPVDVPRLLRQYGLRPDKRLGQNFLIDETALARVADAAKIEPDDLVLEVGPGVGSLTRYLAARSRQVVAVELDSDLLPALRQVLAPFDNVQIIEGDILSQDPSKLMGESGYLVVANIPYYITSALIRHLLESRARPERLVITVQKEVAARITAAPGDLSLLALSVQVYGKPKIAASVPAGAFYPPPKVDSAVVRVDLHASPLIPPAHIETFFRLAKAGFSQKRKTLRNALSGGLGLPASQVDALLERAGLDPRRRAETLSLQEWEQLTHIYSQSSP